MNMSYLRRRKEGGGGKQQKRTTCLGVLAALGKGNTPKTVNTAFVRVLEALNLGNPQKPVIIPKPGTEHQPDLAPAEFPPRRAPAVHAAPASGGAEAEPELENGSVLA